MFSGKITIVDGSQNHSYMDELSADYIWLYIP